MGQYRVTLARGQHAQQAAISAGAAEAQTDTVSLNIDSSKMSKGDALVMLGEIEQRLFSGKWPPVFTKSPVVLPSSAMVAFMGDSIMAGTGAAGHSIPFILGYPAAYKIDTTYALAGTTLLTAQGTVSDLYDGTRPDVVVIQRGTNDFPAGATAATLFAADKDRVFRYRTQGFRVVTSTILPRLDGSFGWSTSLDQARLDYNALVRANSAGADSVVDGASDPIMGAASAPSNNNLYGDGTHPTPAGHDILLPLYRAAIDAALLKGAQVPALLGCQNNPFLTADGNDYIYAGSPIETPGNYNERAVASTYTQLAADGYVQWTAVGSAGAGGYFAGFCTNLSPTQYQDIVYGVFCDGGNAGPNYNLPRGIPEPTRSPQAIVAEDVCRLTRAGSTITFTVNGAPNFVWTAASTAPVVFLFHASGNGATGRIKNVALSGFA